MPVSAYFPDAPEEPLARLMLPPEPTPPPPVPYPSVRVQDLPWEGGKPAVRNAGDGSFLKFPSVRTALWDRTPRGESVKLSTATPHMALLPRLLPQLAKHAQNGPGAPAAALQATVSPPPDDVGARALGSSLHSFDVFADTFGAAQLGRRPERASMPGQDAVQRCSIRVHTTASVDSTGDPRAAAEAYAELLRRGTDAIDGTGPLLLGEALPAHCIASVSPDGGRLSLRLEALVPTLALQATPLYALNILRSPLSDSLRASAMRAQLRSGYLTMDQGRKLVVLGETDPMTFQVPLVGVWVSGVRNVTDAYAWAACVRFARFRPNGPCGAEAVTASDGSHSFLMLVYEEWSDDYGESAGASIVAPQLYECTPRGTYAPYKLVARSLQVSLPLPSVATAPLRCDLFSTESSELSRLMRQLEPFPREGSTLAAAAHDPRGQRPARARKTSESLR
jgi:hypothetical protein